MATVYFTNNADSGDGSLRAALSTAASGDIVTYADSAFADTDEIVILLSSELAPLPTKEITIDGRNKRIVLDGQSVTRLLRCGSTDITLSQTYINIDFINGYSDSYKAPINITRATSTFKRCRILGGRGTSSVSKSNAGINVEYEATFTMVDCLVSGCHRVGVNIGSSEFNEVIIKRCTIVGNVIDISVYNASTANTITDCLIASKTGPGATDIITTLPSTCGFVAPCPDTIDPASWNNALWQSWDFRLTPESPYLTGSETVEAGDADLLGNPRQVGGALGAFEGSWLVGSQTISSDTTADYCEFRADDVITLEGVGRILRIGRQAYVDNADFVSATRGYFVTSPGSDVSAAVFTRVVACEFGANVSSFSARETGASWISQNPSVSILIEQSVNGSWTVLAQLAGEQYSKPLKAGSRLRLFDGVNFFETTVKNANPWKLSAWTDSAWTLPEWNPINSKE